MITSRRTPLDLAVDAGTALVLVTLAWGGTWTLLAHGWHVAGGIAAVAVLTVVMDRLVRTMIGTASPGARWIAGGALAAAVATALIEGAEIVRALPSP